MLWCTVLYVFHPILSPFSLFSPSNSLLMRMPPFFSILYFVNFSLVYIVDVPIFPHLCLLWRVYFSILSRFRRLFFRYIGDIVFCHFVSLLYLFLSSMPKWMHWVWIVDILCVVPMLSMFCLFDMKWRAPNLFYVFVGTFFFFCPPSLPSQHFANQILYFSYQFVFVLFFCVLLLLVHIVKGFTSVVLFRKIVKIIRSNDFVIVISLTTMHSQNHLEKSSLFHLFIILIEIAHMLRMVWMEWSK